MSQSGKVTLQVTHISASKQTTRRSHLYPTESCNVECVLLRFNRPRWSQRMRLAASEWQWVDLNRCFVCLRDSGCSSRLFFPLPPPRPPPPPGVTVCYEGVHWIEIGSWKSVGWKRSGREGRLPPGPCRRSNGSEVIYRQRPQASVGCVLF